MLLSRGSGIVYAVRGCGSNELEALAGKERMEETMNNLELQKRANDVRKGIVTAVHSAKAGHPGGSLSAADVFTFLYFEERNIDPKNTKKEDRDRLYFPRDIQRPDSTQRLQTEATSRWKI